MSRRFTHLVLCATLAAGLVGCSQQREEPVPPAAPGTTAPRGTARGEPVARIGKDITITVGQLSDALNAQHPYVRMRYASTERKQAFLKNLVRLEVLAAEARQRGLDRDPEVQRRVKRVMVDLLMERLHKELVKFESITDDDAQAYYDQHKQQFQQPAKVRASVIIVKTRAEADRVLALAREKPGNVRHFAELVSAHSIDEPTKARRGDLDFFTADSTTRPRALVKAAFAIEGLWQLGGPVRTPQGFAVLMKTGEQAAVHRAFAAEKQRIKNRLFNQRRFEAVNRYVDELQQKARIEIDEKNLARVEIEPPPASDAGGQAEEPRR